MDHPLIHPNQIQMSVMPISDDLFHENWKLGIVHKKVFIPFKTDRTTVYFDSRVPKKCEITECAHIIMMSETEWDPQSV